MGWKEYYERSKPLSFQAHTYAYERAIERLSGIEPEIIAPSRPLNFVLGGFHPFLGTPEAFLKLCAKIHLHPGDQYFLVDMNEYPLVNIDLEVFPPKTWKLQCRVEALPFKKGTVDFLFLDRTFDFMDSEQIRKLADFSKQTLSTNGLIFATFCETGIKIWDKFLGRLTTHVPFYPHSSSEIKELTEPAFKVVLQAVCVDGASSLVVLSRKKSIFPEHQGFPFDYDYAFFVLNY